jgi:hypothetical protein
VTKRLYDAMTGSAMQPACARPGAGSVELAMAFAGVAIAGATAWHHTAKNASVRHLGLVRGRSG